MITDQVAGEQRSPMETRTPPRDFCQRSLGARSLSHRNVVEIEREADQVEGGRFNVHRMPWKQTIELALSMSA